MTPDDPNKQRQTVAQVPERANKTVGRDPDAQSLSQQIKIEGSAINSIARFVKTAGCWAWQPIRWMDSHHGFMTFLVTAVIGSLTAYYAIYSKKQWETMQQQLDLSQRPSIEPQLEKISPLIYRDGRWTATVTGSLKNHGESAALNIGTYAEMLPIHSDTQFGPAMRRQKEWCDANRHPKSTFATGYIVFPKEVETWRSIIGISEKDMSAKTIGLAVVGCVHYRASYDAAVKPTRQTRYAYILSTSGDGATLGIPETKEPTKMFLVKLPALWSAD